MDQRVSGTDFSQWKRRILLSKLKMKSTNFLEKYICDPITRKLTGLIFSTPTVKDLVSKSLNVFLMSVSFNANHFWMKHWTLVRKDLNNQTSFLWVEWAAALKCLQGKQSLRQSSWAFYDYFDSTFELVLIFHCNFCSKNAWLVMDISREIPFLNSHSFLR